MGVSWGPQQPQRRRQFRLGQYRIVHFVSHGIFNSNAPERSGIVLSGLSEAGVVQAELLSPTYAFNKMNRAATE